MNQFEAHRSEDLILANYLATPSLSFVILVICFHLKCVKKAYADEKMDLC